MAIVMHADLLLPSVVIPTCKLRTRDLDESTEPTASHPALRKPFRFEARPRERERERDRERRILSPS